MLCPTCNDPLLIVECEGVELDVCIQRHGLWFDADELTQLFDLIEAPEGLRDLEERLVELKLPGEARRRCPRCKTKMVLVEEPGPSTDVILDRCPDNHGLWFDEGELHEVLTSELSAEDASLARVRKHLGAFVAPKVAKESEDA